MYFITLSAPMLLHYWVNLVARRYARRLYSSDGSHGDCQPNSQISFCHLLAFHGPNNWFQSAPVSSHTPGRGQIVPEGNRANTNYNCKGDNCKGDWLMCNLCIVLISGKQGKCVWYYIRTWSQPMRYVSRFLLWIHRTLSKHETFCGL